MVYLKPCDSVYKLSTLPRWLRDWINENNVNYSGVIQEVFIKIIREQDPEYFERNKLNLEKRTPRKIEATKMLIQS